MWWQIILGIVGVHVLEAIVVAFWILVKKVTAQQKVIDEQQKYIEAVSITVSNMNDELRQIDERGTFSSDDEVGFFFEKLKDMQALLNTFKIN